MRGQDANHEPEPQAVQALAECLESMRRGQSLDAALADFPGMEPVLAPSLRAAQVLQRRANAAANPRRIALAPNWRPWRTVISPARPRYEPGSLSEEAFDRGWNRIQAALDRSRERKNRTVRRQWATVGALLAALALIVALSSPSLQTLAARWTVDELMSSVQSAVQHVEQQVQQILAGKGSPDSSPILGGKSATPTSAPGVQAPVHATTPTFTATAIATIQPAIVASPTVPTLQSLATATPPASVRAVATPIPLVPSLSQPTPLTLPVVSPSVLPVVGSNNSSPAPLPSVQPKVALPSSPPLVETALPPLIKTVIPVVKTPLPAPTKILPCIVGGINLPPGSCK